MRSYQPHLHTTQRHSYVSIIAPNATGPQHKIQSEANGQQLSQLFCSNAWISCMPDAWYCRHGCTNICHCCCGVAAGAAAMLKLPHSSFQVTWASVAQQPHLRNRQRIGSNTSWPHWLMHPF